MWTSVFYWWKWKTKTERNKEFSTLSDNSNVEMVIALLENLKFKINSYLAKTFEFDYNKFLTLRTWRMHNKWLNALVFWISKWFLYSFSYDSGLIPIMQFNILMIQELVIKCLTIENQSSWKFIDFIFNDWNFDEILRFARHWENTEYSS